MNKPLVIHPFLFAIFPILSLYAFNIDEVPFHLTLLPLITVLGFTASLVFLSRLIHMDIKKAGIFVSLFLVFFFSYGHVYVLRIADYDIFRHRYLMPAWGILFMCGAYFIIKSRSNLNNFTNILNIIAFSLIIFSIFNIVSYKVKTRTSLQYFRSIKKDEPSSLDKNKSNTFRDIYYIILDRYASASTLQETYGFDNSEFIDYLSNKGFYVASQSKSNYPGTSLSVASSLNMEYINYISDIVGKEFTDWSIVFTMLQDYKVWRFLKSRGYQFIHFGSIWDARTKNKYADLDFSLQLLHDPFSMFLYSTTVAYPIGSLLFNFDIREEKRRIVLHQFDNLAEIPNIKEPTFVFADILITHFPYIFDRDGNYLTEQEVKKRNPVTNYVEHVIFTNKKLKVLIDKLLSKSEISPIIILQADEGPWPLSFILNPDKQKNRFMYKHASAGELKEKFSILNAYYLPDVNKNILYPHITPVNTFRLIFNHYFDLNLKLLPDRSYALKDTNRPYSFFDVTDRLE